MKRKTKKGSALYSFLEQQGVLKSDNTELIHNAKKHYWSEYRKQWKKTKRQRSKSFEVLFTFKETNIITRKARKYHTSPTNYIKQSALTVKQIFDRVAIGEIRELLILHSSILQSHMEENILPQKLGNQLLQQMSQLEKKVLSVFNQNKQQ